MSLSIFTPIFFITILAFRCACVIRIDAQCLETQRNMLLQFNNTLKFDSSVSTKLVKWYMNTNCCSWEGINCSKAGHVTGLDLSGELIFGGINSSSTLFSLNFLENLNLADNFLSGAIPNSMGNLTQLIRLDLSRNKFTGQMPSFERSKNLTHINLFRNNFSGPIPSDYFKGLLKLESVDLSDNSLSGRIPSSLFYLPSLQEISLAYNQFEGEIPEIPNASSSPLRLLDLGANKLKGEIPNSMGNLTQLLKVYLSMNKFTGPMPSFQKSKNLTHIYLDDNTFSGLIPSNNFQGLLKLVQIDLSFNSFSGTIPSSMFRLPSLQELSLRNNQFEGHIPEIPNASSSSLFRLQLERNKLEGEIPYSFFDLESLEYFVLSYNRLNNSIRSHLPPNLVELELASCNLRDFPDLRNLSYLTYLDLSNNQIGGEIPNWIWTFSSWLEYLDLSRNIFENLQEPYNASSCDIQTLDLSSNHLQGEVPIPQNMSFVSFSAANNKLSGTIPQSICNFTGLQVLDLSNNSLSGTIPLCLIEWRQKELAVLNLGKNYLTGNISGTFQNTCGLEVLDLHDNHLQGKIPKSLVNCRYLELLNLGKNRILDTFPSFLSNSTSLSVLVLRSNLFHGVIPCSGVNNSWSEIQIFDLSSNNFSGSLIPKCFLNFKAMMNPADALTPKADYLSYFIGGIAQRDYMFKVTVTNKDQQMELEKLLTIFTVIDFSMNNLVGEIPNTIGKLELLYVLNLSHNGFTGSIPSSFGNLKQLGSLDLSANKLIGKIPTELASLTFLSVLNLSHNQLSGKIPTGPQLQTFPVSSFQGNNGLCGLPLNKSCYDADNVTPTTTDNQLQHEDGTKWEFLSGGGVGYAVGLGLVIVPLFFCKRWSIFYWKYVDRLTFLIVGEKYLRRRKGYR